MHTLEGYCWRCGVKGDSSSLWQEEVTDIQLCSRCLVDDTRGGGVKECHICHAFYDGWLVDHWAYRHQNTSIPMRPLH